MAETISDQERRELLARKVEELERDGFRVSDRKEDRVELVREYESKLVTVEADGTVNVAP